MITGLIGIKFKDGVTGEEIENVISNFYGENDKLITGMQYLEFRDPKTLKKIFEFIEKDDEEISKGNAFQTRIVDTMEAGKF